MHDILCPAYSSNNMLVNDFYLGKCDCESIDVIRADERRRTLDDAEALIRAYFRQHGWQASANHLIDWLDRIVTP